MFNTYVKPSSDLRNKYPEISQLVKGNNQVVITNNGKADMVLLNMEDYKKYEEFLHLRYVEEKLAEAEKIADSSDAKWYDHNDFWNKVRSL